MKKLKVLYAEDPESICGVTKKIFSSFFDHIDVAKDGEDALALYKDYHEDSREYYDIVITNLEIPKIDGKKLSKLILEFNANQEVVVISGVEDFEKLVDLLNMGIKYFISKPIDKKQLDEVIESVVASIRKRRLDEDEREEILEYNEVLKKREDEQKRLLDIKIKELKEFNSALDVSAIVSKSDPKGIITYVNDEFCKVCGYTKEELIGQNNNIVKSDRRSKSFYQKLWNIINSKRTYKTIFENRRKDGSRYWIESTINPILGMDGEILEFIAVSHDMTKLVESLEKTKQAEKSKEEFFINISHEMKTPLNSILGFSSLLSKRLKDDEKSLLMVNKIQETGDDLNNIVESILDLRKIREHTLELHETPFNPYNEIEKYMPKYMEKATEKSIEFKWKMEGEFPENLLGDSTRIAQVVGTLLDNAIKFTQNGGKVQTNIIYDKFNRSLLFEVKDNGIGIKKENQSKIFDLQQLDSSQTREHEGAGLGLNIAKNLLTIMKGSIALKSVPGRGSLFTVEIPLKTA